MGLLEMGELRLDSAICGFMYTIVRPQYQELSALFRFALRASSLLITPREHMYIPYDMT
jgi:hypothetical protein